MSALIIFDLDGTVLDTISDLSDAVNHGLESCGFPKRSRDEVMSFVGNGVVKLIERALPEGEKTPENIEKVHNLFNEYYAAHYADKTRPYDGMAELLREIKGCGCRLAVLSNKPDEFTKRLIERFYPGIFDHVSGSGDAFPRKPDPAAENYIMRLAGAAPDTTVHIGDSDTDLMTAKNAGVEFIGVSWGYRSESSLRAKGAKTVAGDIKSLREAIMDIIKK